MVCVGAINVIEETFFLLLKVLNINNIYSTPSLNYKDHTRVDWQASVATKHMYENMNSIH